MNEDALLPALQSALPIDLAPGVVDLASAGLIIVDEVNGFCTVGAGNLAPAEPNAQVSAMVVETDRLARIFTEANRPVLAFLDTHEPGKPEPPYPPHCELGTGEENLVPELEWLEGADTATLVRKDCINGFVGAIETAEDGWHHNRLTAWANDYGLKTVLIIGICTDICVLDLVLTLLSARNHGLMGSVRDIVVQSSACATYDLSAEAVRELGLPATAAHPQALTHHVGLYLMASRGAVLASEVTFDG
ncbi:MAG: isochorismatase family protein [Geminicoccaceae bacterium]